MRTTQYLLLLAFACRSYGREFARAVPNDGNTTTSQDVTPKRYIVELATRLDASSLSAELSRSRTSNLRITKEFNSDIFPAVSVECSTGCNSESIKSSLSELLGRSVVTAIYKSTPMFLPPTIAEDSFSDDAAAMNYSVHGLTGVDKLHQQGILGKGATVAVVDSGVQYNHPGLGGGLGAEFTVVGGFDLIGDSWPDTPAQPDNDPMDQLGHGTHCAGIIAGKSDQFVGVAPESKILAYRVISGQGYSNEETVIEGFLKAFESGADIISASLGEESGFTTNALAVVASRIVQQGVVVVVAAGNAGEDGPFAASNGASGKDALTVASSEPGTFPAQAFSASFSDENSVNETKVAYVSGTAPWPNTIIDQPILPLILNTSVENDACAPLPVDTRNLTDVVVLVRLGGCRITEKKKNLEAFGARFTLYYNTDGPLIFPTGSDASGYMGIIEARAGAAIISTIAEGGNVTASFNGNPSQYVGIYNSGSGRPARYSSWGGTYDLALKPDIAAPGTRILSTYITDQYRVLSGTSMATPYIAGIAALWVSKFGGRAAHADDPAWAQRLIARITSTGRAMPWADWATTDEDYGFWSPPTQVGSGLVDAESVLEYTTDFNFEGRKFELNDTAYFKGTHTVDITNHGNDEVTYEFTLQEAGAYDSWIPAIPGQEQYGIPRVKYYSDIELTNLDHAVSLPSSLTLGPGETGIAEVVFSPPTNANSSNLPIYGGKILVSGSNGEELGIPYLGVASDLRETIGSVWDSGAYFPLLQSGVFNTPIAEKSNFTFNLTRASQDFPKLLTQLSYGSREIRWDIYTANFTESDWTYPPTPGLNGFVGSATAWNGTDKSSWFDPEINSEDDIFSFPLANQPRERRHTAYWLGRYADGTQITVGEYRFRIAALLPFGDPGVAEDWDVWTTPVVTFI